MEAHPATTAKTVLWNNTPDVLRFDLGERQLASSYDLDEVAGDPPQALANLAALIELDLRSLKAAIDSRDRGAVLESLDAANANLSQRLSENWAQTDVEARLTTDDSMLSILVRTAGGGYHDIAQRSDGLRAFIALVAFTAEYSRGVAPILIIDEAEIHLHYDAQADLVQMLARQERANQVIYTTHSAGCLPMDLGTGVRLVVPSSAGDRSAVENWPWTRQAGFGPLLLGMGASTMAFVPTRSAVIGEGASEVIMLPTLLREATGARVLPFQVAPGSAEASRAAIAHIDLQGSRVAWLVDGDGGGTKNLKHLVAAGIPRDRIVVLGGEGSGVAVEDLLDANVLADAVAEELRRSNGTEIDTFSADDLPEIGRPWAIEVWCDERRLRRPNKGAVCHRVIEQRSERVMLDPARRPLVRELYERLIAVLG
jgi:hypothetical protein